MGVGKTTLVRFLTEALGASPATSPTYSIFNKYEAPELILYHVDLYRVETLEDLDSTGFWDLFSDRQAVILIEWAERIDADDYPKDWPMKTWSLSFSADGVSRHLDVS